jgi:hypothetical protein
MSAAGGSGHHVADAGTGLGPGVAKPGAPTDTPENIFAAKQFSCALFFAGLT